MHFRPEAGFARGLFFQVKPSSWTFKFVFIASKGSEMTFYSNILKSKAMAPLVVIGSTTCLS
jgi:hypothetical protein